MLKQVVSIAHRVVPGADLVSVTLRSPDGGFHTPVETDPAASALDKLQYKTGEGPCIEAACATGPAKGILMHRRGISADEAFDLLRRTSQDLDVKLTEVARTLATRHTDLGPPEH